MTTKNIQNHCLLLLIACMSSCSTIPSKLLYLEQTPPQNTPQIFAPGIISHSDSYEFGSVFSKKGDEFYYAVDIDGRTEIRYSRIENKHWSTPTTILSDSIYGYNDPFLSPNEDKLFYISDRPTDPLDTTKNINIWYSQKMDDIWSSPIFAGDQINSPKNEYYISFTADGSMYFASNKASEDHRTHDFDIYKSNYINGSFQSPKKLSDAINTGRYEADVFISPDESYIIFCSIRRSGLGRGDLYISFKDEKNNWTEAQNMGVLINSKNHELCPFVTHDGKFLFYTSNSDIYWVSMDIIEQFR